MGRNYIAERTWADPKERAAQKGLKRERKRKRGAERSQGLAQYLVRAGACWIKGCGRPTSPGWMGCCGEQCHKAMLKELDRRAEVKQARRQGVPVAEYRKQIQR